ncbi:MAG: hypothetical protein MJZ78_03305, partial [Bacteroidales bacterium]|nr:hypothetical protein [Bacteroidales bacterium]
DWQTSGKEPYASSYSYSTRTTSDVFFTNSSSFQVAGETAGTWRTLNKEEWDYLLNTRTNASSLRTWKELDSGAHNGLVILPDGTENPSAVMGGITSTSDLASSGAVFLPSACYRDGVDVFDAGSRGDYWSGTPYESGGDRTYVMHFLSGDVGVRNDYRKNGYSVRLVR